MQPLIDPALLNASIRLTSTDPAEIAAVTPDLDPTTLLQVGFTGTRHGMSTQQAAAVHALFLVLGQRRVSAATAPSERPFALHHGCCVGADALAHTIARELGAWIIGHPPINTARVARAALDDCDDRRRPYDYLVRDRHIVNETTIVVATPLGLEAEEPRSGTWFTVRAAREANRELYVIGRDGRVMEHRVAKRYAAE